MADQRSRRAQGEQENGAAAGYVVPVKRPNVLHRDGIGKHRAVAIELELRAERDDHECDGPCKACRDDEPSEQTLIRRDAG